MGITIKEHGPVVWDRSVHLICLYTDSDDRNAWRILTQWQDAPYEGDTRLDAPRANTEQVEVFYKELKGMEVAGGPPLGDADLLRIRAITYALREHKLAGTGPFAPPA